MPLQSRTLGSQIPVVIPDIVLRALRGAAYMASIREYRQAAELALNITEVVQGTRRGMDDLQRLAQHACMVVCAILHRHITTDDTVVGEHTDLGNSQELLTSTLSSIERFASKRASRDAFMCMVMHIFDSNRIRKYREDLERILGLFGLMSDSLVPGTLEHIALQLEKNLRELASRRREDRDRGSLQREPLDRATTSMTGSLQNNQNPFLPYIQQTHQAFVRTVVGGVQRVVDDSIHISNTNSGNTTTTITAYSNNRY